MRTREGGGQAVPLQGNGKVDQSAGYPPATQFDVFNDVQATHHTCGSLKLCPDLVLPTASMSQLSNTQQTIDVNPRRRPNKFPG
jgi:hypothetical protein